MNLKCFWNTDGLLHFVKWKCESLANRITTSLVKSLQCCVIILLSRKYRSSVFYVLSWSAIYLPQGNCTCTWGKIHVWGAQLGSFVMKKVHTILDYQFHAQLECLLRMIPAAHTVILLSESLLSPARPIPAGLSCWTISYWAKDWKWERRAWTRGWPKRGKGVRAGDTAEGKARQRGQRMNEGRTRGWLRRQTSERKKLWS